MGKVNVCFKGVFVFFNALFHGWGWMMIMGAVKSSGMMPGGAMIFLWLFIIGMICISGLGIYGGRTENAPALKVFGGCVAVGMVIMLICGFVGLGERKQIQDAISGSAEFTKEEAEFLDKLMQIGLGIFFGLFVAGVLSVLMTSMMIYQINRHESGGTASFSKHVA